MPRPPPVWSRVGVTSGGVKPLRALRDQPGGEVCVRCPGVSKDSLRQAHKLARLTRYAPQHERVSLHLSGVRYPDAMDHDKHLQRHLDLCRRIYLRMVAEGTWPPTHQPESPDAKDVVESEDTNGTL